MLNSWVSCIQVVVVVDCNTVTVDLIKVVAVTDCIIAIVDRTKLIVVDHTTFAVNCTVVVDSIEVVTRWPATLPVAIF